MRILVRSEAWVENRCLPDQPFVIVSIASPGRKANIPANPLCRDILYIQFHDVSRSYTLSRPGEPETRTIDPITQEQANEIWAFVKKHEDIPVLICQCEAGISRSAGVAAAVSKILTGDDTFFFANYMPNSAVYQAVFNAAGLGAVEVPQTKRAEKEFDISFTDSESDAMSDDTEYNCEGEPCSTSNSESPLDE